MAKKFRLLPRENVDVLVYDAEASHLLHHSIPEEAKTFWMETRRTIHIIPSFYFLVTFLKHLIGERAIGVARLFAIFDSLNCKVILTKTSVQPYLGRYAFLRPECLVIAIQATTRSSIGTKQKMQIAPSYYCFGQAEKDLFSIFEIPAKEIIVSGSYDLGVFTEQQKYSAVSQDEPYDICFISGWRPQLEVKNISKNYQILKESHDLLISWTAQLCRENNLRLLIPGRMRHPKRDEVFPAEREYFAGYCKDCEYEILCLSKGSLSSYSAINASRLVIHLYSTLGWEALGTGKKVLFAGGVNPKMMKMISMLYWIKFLPEEIIIRESRYEEFSKKALMLLGMQDDRYAETIRTAKSYYMAQDLESPPHKVIQQRILSKLQSVE